MIKSDMLVAIHEDVMSLCTLITFYEIRGKECWLWNAYTNDYKQHNECNPIPTEYQIRLPRILAQNLLKNLSQELDNHGFKADSQSKVEGVLEATKAHLDDMRKLVFKHQKGDK